MHSLKELETMKQAYLSIADDLQTRGRSASADAYRQFAQSVQMQMDGRLKLEQAQRTLHNHRVQFPARCECCNEVLPASWHSNSQYRICPLCEDESGA